MAFDLSLLGVKKNVPKVNFTEYSGVFEAPEKFGKTATASLFPNAILLAFEKGYRAQSLNVRDINKWEDVINFISMLKKHRLEIGDEIQTIVFDTADEAYPMAEPYMCRKEGVKDGKIYTDKTQIAYGQGWGLHDKYFKDAIREIHNLGFSILYLTHSMVKTIKPKDGEEYQMHKSTMSDRLAGIIYPEVDYIIHGERVKVDIGNGKKEMKRALVVKGNDESIAGNRVYFDENIIFDSEEEAIEKFQQQFEAKIKLNLEKAGINDDFDKLKKTQKEERLKEVTEFVKTEDGIDIEENMSLKEIIQTKFPKATKEIKDAIKVVMSANDIDSFKDVSSINTSALQEIVALLN